MLRAMNSTPAIREGKSIAYVLQFAWFRTDELVVERPIEMGLTIVTTMTGGLRFIGFVELPSADLNPPVRIRDMAVSANPWTKASSAFICVICG
jgi:hypothetical protein